MFLPYFGGLRYAFDQSWENHLLEGERKPILEIEGGFGN